MVITRQELIEFLHDITSTVSISEKENVEKKIELFIENFETKFSCELEEVDKSSYIYVKELSETIQQEIKIQIIERLKSLGLYSPENMERAMDSKLKDLSDLLDIKKYEQIIKEEKEKKVSVQNRGTRQ